MGDGIKSRRDKAQKKAAQRQTHLQAGNYSDPAQDLRKGIISGASHDITEWRLQFESHVR